MRAEALKPVAFVIPLVAAGTLAAPAAGVVVEGGSSPVTGLVGWWNGASGVPVAPNWIISARHVGGGEGTIFVMGGVRYTADLVIGHPTQDVLLARLTEPLPAWHRLAPLASAGQEVVLGGMGFREGAFLGNGWSWGASGEAWGSNRLDGVGARMMITFDAPGSAAATEGESIFTQQDSGGGVFTLGPSGELELAGIAVSVSGPFGSSLYGSRAYAVNLEPLHAWILSHIAPGVPIASSVGPAWDRSFHQMPQVPAPAASVALALAAGAWAVRRRRP